MTSEPITSTLQYIVAVAELFIMLRLFNLVFMKIIERSKSNLYPAIERRKSILKDLFLSVFYNAMFVFTKSFAISLISGFIMSEIVVNVGERINGMDQNSK